jgi:hypothetical protein
LSEESLLILLLHLQSSPLPRIVTPLNVIKDIGPRLGSRPIVQPVHPFALKHIEEAPGRGVVRAAAHHTHAADDLVGRQEPLVFLRDKLTTSIRVQE